MPDIVVMFFVLGLVAGLLKSDLKIPKAAYDTLSLLLMLTIGLKGGMALYGSLEWALVFELLAIASLGAIIPFIVIPILLKVAKADHANAASLAAHYGSVSAGTFAVALAYVETAGLAIEPQVTLYLVMLELPAILVALAFYRRHTRNDSDSSKNKFIINNEIITCFIRFFLSKFIIIVSSLTLYSVCLTVCLTFCLIRAHHY